MVFLCVHTPLTQHGCPLVLCLFHVVHCRGFWDEALCQQLASERMLDINLIGLRRGNDLTLPHIWGLYMYCYYQAALMRNRSSDFYLLPSSDKFQVLWFCCPWSDLCGWDLSSTYSSSWAVVLYLDVSFSEKYDWDLAFRPLHFVLRFRFKVHLPPTCTPHIVGTWII